MTVICSEVLLWFLVGRSDHDYLIRFRWSKTKKRGPEDYGNCSSTTTVQS